MLAFTKRLHWWANPLVHVSVSTQAASYGSDTDGKILPVQAGVQQEDSGALSDQAQSPMSEASYKEEPSPVPEPTLPEDFLEEEEQYREFALTAEMGEEKFIDRQEHTVAVASNQLSPEGIPEREVGFKVTLEDYSPLGGPKGFPGAGEDSQQGSAV